MKSKERQFIDKNDGKQIMKDFQVEADYLDSIALDICNFMKDDYIYIFGPGKPAQAVLERLGINKSPYTVNVLRNRKPVPEDYGIEQMVADKQHVIFMVSPGEDGCVFGQELREYCLNLIDKLSHDSIHILATPTMIKRQQGRPFTANTGDLDLDEQLSSYFKVVTSYGRRAIYKVSPIH